MNYAYFSNSSLNLTFSQQLICNETQIKLCDALNESVDSAFFYIGFAIFLLFIKNKASKFLIERYNIDYFENTILPEFIIFVCYVFLLFIRYGLL